MTDTPQPQTLGFIGTGHITSCVVTGLLTSDVPPAAIVVSPRNVAVAKSLKERFSRVTVASDNQEVIDACEAVFLAVRPQLAEEIIGPLAFRPEQLVISLMATISLERLVTLIGARNTPRNTPRNTLGNTIVRALPLPPIAKGAGPTVMFPDEPRVRGLLDSVGTAVPVEDEIVFDRVGALTGLAASYYQLLETCARWATDQGVPKAVANRYMASLFHGLAADALGTGERGFAPLVEGLATPETLNLRGIETVREGGGFTAFEAALDQVRARIEKNE